MECYEIIRNIYSDNVKIFILMVYKIEVMLFCEL